MGPDLFRLVSMLGRVVARLGGGGGGGGGESAV